MNWQSPFSDTIFALSSGRLPAGVAVIRLSGPRAREVGAEIGGRATEPRVMSFVRFRDESGVTIDHGLSVLFAGPESFTGEDCVEFHMHGGRAVAARMLKVLTGKPGLRMAAAGEFTRRAFVNGKIDLTGAEALADLVDSETEAQRRFAVENAGGRQAELYSAWRERIINSRALVEAELDFADEEGVPASVSERIWSDVRGLSEEIQGHVRGYDRAEIIRHGFKVAIVGAANAGKSSLLNALARRDVAIVSEEPGTTRDIVTVTLDLDGMAVIVSDTAGIRENPGAVESMGIERSFRTAREADLVVFVCEAGMERPAIGGIEGKGTLNVRSKCDLIVDRHEDQNGWIALSSKTGEGIDRLLERMSSEARKLAGPMGDVLPSRQRHIDALNQAARHLDEASAGSGRDLEVRAEELRLASDELGRITGMVDVEDLLDRIFSSFCIGK